MKTVSDFKKRLAPGVLIHCIYHQKSAGRNENGNIILVDEDRGIRPVGKVQSNAFTLLTTKTDGSVVDSWCYYPKASSVHIIDENTIQILDFDFRVRDESKLIPCLTYKFV